MKIKKYGGVRSTTTSLRKFTLLPWRRNYLAWNTCVTRLKGYGNPNPKVHFTQPSALWSDQTRFNSLHHQYATMPKAMIQWLPTGLPDSNVQYHCLITFSCQDGSLSVRDQSQQRHCSCSVTDNVSYLTQWNFQISFLDKTGYRWTL